MTFRLIDDWRRCLRQLWSIRAALVLAAFNGIIGIASVFQNMVPLWAYVILNTVGPMLVVVLRVIKQPELEQ